MDIEMAAFLRDYQPLPEPGGYISRRPTAPCGDCGKALFAVSRSRREAQPLDDGQVRRWETLDVHCPDCPLLGDKTVVSRKVIGRFDTRTGELTIDEARAKGVA